jgi:HK97 family phage major capsid protein
MNMHQPRVRGIVSARAEANPVDIKAAVDRIHTTFEEFKAANEARLKEIERGREDVVTTEKLGRVNDEVTQLTGAINEMKESVAALKLGGGGKQGQSAEARQHADAFNSWFRKGREPDAGLRGLEVKAGLTTQSDPDGGFLVPEQMDGTITRVLANVSAVRSLARVVSITANDYDVLVSKGGAVSGWVGEEDARAVTGTPQLSKISVNSGEIYAQPAATQRALDDAAFDVESWLAEEVSITFAEQEGAAFVSGDGVKKPRGFLTETPVANGSYAWGKIGFVATGSSGAFATAGADNLIALYYALKAGYRNGAAFLTSDATLGTIRGFKDTTNNYIWAPPTSDMPATILGKPVATDDNMPAVGANSFSVAFGNWQRGYLIADRLGVRVLRDPYTSKPNVLFYTTKRVGGGVVNYEAIKTLKFA